MNQKIELTTISANCGNDGIGPKASESIAMLLKSPANPIADCVVVNCQETDFKKTLKQLKKQLPPGYAVVRSSSVMATHTKFKAGVQLTEGYGIATYVIYNTATMERPKCNSSKYKRRSNSLVTVTEEGFDASGYNKGGLNSSFILRKKSGGKSVTLETISGHLESFSVQNRCQDWANLIKLSSKQVNNWVELVAAIPDISALGCDMNVRREKLLDSGNKFVNPWDLGDTHPGVQAIYKLLPGNNYSAENTYNLGDPQALTRESRKRKGLADGGSLDVNSLNLNTEPLNKHVEMLPNDLVVGLDPPNKRDHAVIINKVQAFEPIVNDFDRIKGHLINRLALVAPTLVGEIKKLPDNEENRAKLVKVYQKFIAPEGLINQALDLYVNKSGAYEKLKRAPFYNKDLDDQLVAVLFSEDSWFNDCTMKNLDTYSKQEEQEMMNVLISSLQECHSAEGLKERIEFYKFFVKLDPRPVIDQLKQGLNDSIKVDYEQNLEVFVDAISTSDRSDPVVCACMNLCEQVKQINQSKPAIDNQTQVQLNKVLNLCTQVYRISQNESSDQKAEMKRVSKELIKVTDALSGNSPHRYKKLPGNFALGLGGAVTVLLGIVLVGVGILTAVTTDLAVIKKGLGLVHTGVHFASNIGKGSSTKSGEELAEQMKFFKDTITQLDDDKRNQKKGDKQHDNRNSMMKPLLGGSSE